MKDTAKRRSASQEAPSAQLAFAAMRDARATLHDAIVSAGMSVLSAMLEEERTRICGERHVPDPKRVASRAGYTDGELALGGVRVRVRRPRVRTDDREVSLDTWEQFACDDPLSKRAVEQMVLGVSTRNYARSVEPMPASLVTRGASKSAVSRRFVDATTQILAEMMGRDLTALQLCAIMIDGIHVGDHLVLAALGIDVGGIKHVLGVHEGSAENATVCAALISDLIARGVRVDQSMLFVIDGSKALAKAIRDAFGTRGVVQRCQVHKRRNVEDHLPESMRKTVGRTMSTAYRCGDAARAKRMLEALARQLEKKHPAAAASLREGLDDTLTVMRFALDPWLERTLATTNAIEFINSRIRVTTHNVAKWNGGEMVLRWVATALVEAAKTFRKLRGYKGMPKLVAALAARDQQLTPTSIDRSNKAA